MSNRDERQNLQQAFSLHRGGNFAEAAKLYRKIIKKNPREAHALHSLGIIETADGNHAEAARLMARSLAVQPASVSFMQNYATVLCQLGQYGTASTVCLKGLELDPTNAYLLYVAASALFKQGRLPESLAKFDLLVAQEPNNISAINERSSVLLALERYDAARADIERAIALNPHYAEAHLNMGVLFARLKRHDEAIGSFDTALRLNPNLADAWLGYGNVLFERKRFDEALAASDRARALNPHSEEACIVRGNALCEMKRYDEAARAYDEALALKPGSADAWVGRGNVSYALKQYDEALAAYDKALTFKNTTAQAWLGRGNILLWRLRYEDALACYDRSLACKPGFAEAWLGRGNALVLLKRFNDALAAFDKATGMAEASLGRGNVFYELGRFSEAIAAYDQALALKPDLAEAWSGRGNVLREFKQYEEAIVAYDKALSLKPDLVVAQSARINAKNCICDWSGRDTDCARLISSVRDGEVNVGPVEFLAMPSSAQDQLICAKSWIKLKYPLSAQPLWQGESYAHDRIRIAYLSSDFREHPVSYLAAGMFDHHDKSRFEVTAIAWGLNDHSKIRKRLEASFERFIDVGTQSDDQVAGLIKSLEIDILIDLAGLTKYARPNILARRPSPVQVNYLGYAGTMGAEYMDYIVADPTLIPEQDRQYYMEKIAYLPHTFIPHDDRDRLIADRAFGRADFGLPETGFVFCCFNNAYKLTPDVFRSRMKLLRAVEGSVLWMTDDKPAVANLRKEAAEAGVDPDRLVFASRLPSSAEHLARHRLADIFLDTSPYNAHTTASDALWAGLPVLTQIGETFAGRVAASLLTAVGLPELIVHTPEQFEKMAIELATQPDLLAAIKEELSRNRSTTPLFDTKLFTRHIEGAYTAMYRRHVGGLRPEHIHVPHDLPCTTLP